MNKDNRHSQGEAVIRRLPDPMRLHSLLDDLLHHHPWVERRVGVLEYDLRTASRFASFVFGGDRQVAAMQPDAAVGRRH